MLNSLIFIYNLILMSFLKYSHQLQKESKKAFNSQCQLKQQINLSNSKDGSEGHKKLNFMQNRESNLCQKNHDPAKQSHFPNFLLFKRQDQGDLKRQRAQKPSEITLLAKQRGKKDEVKQKEKPEQCQGEFTIQNKYDSPKWTKSTIGSLKSFKPKFGVKNKEIKKYNMQSLSQSEDYGKIGNNMMQTFGKIANKGTQIKIGSQISSESSQEIGSEEEIKNIFSNKQTCSDRKDEHLNEGKFPKNSEILENSSPMSLKHKNLSKNRSNSKENNQIQPSHRFKPSKINFLKEINDKSDHKTKKNNSLKKQTNLFSLRKMESLKKSPSEKHPCFSFLSKNDIFNKEKEKNPEGFINLKKYTNLAFKKNQQISLLNPFSKTPKIQVFDILKLLVENGNNSIYLVREKKTKFIYCLKKCSISENESPEQGQSEISDEEVKESNLRNLIREAKISQMLDHPNIIKTFCCLIDKDHLYHLLEYMEDSTLQLKIQKQNHDSYYPRQKNRNSAPSAQKIQSIRLMLEQLLSAVSYLHELGIMHRDIKPSNIFISHENSLKLGDFGISLYGEPSDFFGTLDYASPEMILHQHYDFRVDLWAIGCVAYELFTGHPPFYNQDEKITTKNLVACRYDLSAITHQNLRKLISSLLQRNPINRISCHEALNHPFFSQCQKNTP